MDVIEKRILHGDQKAFKEWVERHVREIELFAIQYGASLEEAGAVAETVFRKIYESLEVVTEDSLKENALLTNALKELDGRQTTETSISLFSFEEDNELHRRLIGMPKEYRVPFILERFHNKSFKEIAEITGTTDLQIKQALTKAHSLMYEPDLDKKLEFLNKSYERHSLFYNEANIFHSKVEESPPVEQKRKLDKRKRPYLFWGIGMGVLLFLVSIITYINSDSYQLKSGEKFIEKAKVSFQEELERNLKLAGLPVPKMVRKDIYFETYGEDTRRKFDWFIADLNDQLASDGRIDKKKAKSDYDSLIHELMMPSEMVAELSKKPLVNDQKKSMDFMNEYFRKKNILLNSYMNILDENENLIYDARWIGETGFDFESFTANKSKFPEKFKVALAGMEEQGFYLMSDPPEVFVFPKFGNSEMVSVLQENLHPNMDIYISLLTEVSFNFHLRPIEEQADLLLQTEKAVFWAEEHKELYSDTFNSFTWMLYSVTGMVDQLEIRDSVGVIKKEYKEAWTRIAFNGKNSPSAHIMR